MRLHGLYKLFIKIQDVLVLLMLCVSCQKKANPIPANEPLPISQLPVVGSSSYDALFSVMKNSSRYKGTFGPTSYQCYAYYSSQTIQNEAYVAANLQNIGSVSLNQKLFKTKSSIINNYYNDTTFTAFTQPHNWKVGGAGAVDSFYYSNTNNGPAFGGQTNLPDSMSISSGLYFTLKDLSNCDLIYVFINGGSGSSTYPRKLMAGSDSVIYFSAEQLAGVALTNTGYFSVQLYKDNYRQINGKKINFREGLSFVDYAFKIKK